MLAELCEDLKKAQGRYDYVIAVVCDIRGFTNFSSLRESPEIATLIKLFYIKLLGGYFQAANYVKLTGDGMLLVFQHTDDTLLEVSKSVLHSCLKAVEDFPGMFKDDLMIILILRHASDSGSLADRHFVCIQKKKYWITGEIL